MFMASSNSSKHDYRSRAAPGPTLSDCVSLWLTTLAKWRHRHLQSRRDEDCREFYEQFFSERKYREWSEDERRNIRRKTIAQYLSRHVSQGAYVLDIGCGFGEVLSGISNSYRLQGMDYSDSNVRIAQELLKDQAEVKQGSIYEIPYETASQDVCLCLEVLEHIEDDARAVREIVRVLKPDGILIAAVPPTYYWPQYEELIGHFRHYTRRSFEDLLHRVGFIVTDYLPNYPNWHLAYARRYCWVRFLSMTLGLLMGQRDVFRFKWPWDREPLMQRAKKRLVPLLEKDGLINYSAIDSSTFVVARKPTTTNASAKNL